MTVMSVLPEFAVSPGNSGRSVTTPEIGLRTLGIGDLGLRSEIFSLGGRKLALSLLERRLPAYGFQRFQMVLRDVVCCLRLHQGRSGRVVVSARNRAFGEKLLSRFNNLSLQFELRSCLSHIQFCLVIVLLHLRFGLYVERCLRGGVLALVVESLCRQVAVFKDCE